MNTQKSFSAYPFSALRKPSCALIAFAFTLASVVAHEPGDGERFTAGAGAKTIPAAPPNAASPVTDGQWVTLPYLMPFNPIHCALLHNGK
ncbi:MAG: hypothetical protein ABIU29_12730 [Chthoniobacterales bacterium]